MGEFVISLASGQKLSWVQWYHAQKSDHSDEKAVLLMKNIP